MMALGNGGHTQAIPKLVGWFDRPDPEDSVRDPTGRPYFNTYLRATISCALAAMDDPEARRALVHLSQSKRSFAREAVVTGFAARGSDADIPALARLVREHPGTARFALDFVGRFESRGWPVLRAALEAPGQDRRHAVFMISQLEGAVLEGLVAELKGGASSAQVRRSLALALYWMRSKEAEKVRRDLLALPKLSEDVRSVLVLPRPSSAKAAGRLLALGLHRREPPME